MSTPSIAQIDSLGAAANSAHRLNGNLGRGTTAADAGDGLVSTGNGCYRCGRCRLDPTFDLDQCCARLLKACRVAFGPAREIFRSLGDFLRACAQPLRADVNAADQAAQICQRVIERALQVGVFGRKLSTNVDGQVAISQSPQVLGHRLDDLRTGLHSDIEVGLSDRCILEREHRSSQTTDTVLIGYPFDWRIDIARRQSFHSDHCRDIRFGDGTTEGETGARGTDCGSDADEECCVRRGNERCHCGQRRHGGKEGESNK